MRIPLESRRRPIAQYLDERIAASVSDGICPMCKHDLDPDGLCAICSFDANLPRTPTWTPAMDDDYIPSLPERLFVDERRTK
jgi:hypothetical protein